MVHTARAAQDKHAENTTQEMKARTGMLSKIRVSAIIGMAVPSIAAMTCESRCISSIPLVVQLLVGKTAIQQRGVHLEWPNFPVTMYKPAKQALSQTAGITRKVPTRGSIRKYSRTTDIAGTHRKKLAGKSSTMQLPAP